MLSEGKFADVSRHVIERKGTRMPRRTFFSFHYKRDVHRAWNARNSWVTKEREDAGFFDSSLFEEAQKKSKLALKRFINSGLNNTSVTCVLSGYETWGRYWVRYEIQRSFLDGKGLLAVNIHTIQNLKKETDPEGNNPFDYIAFHIDDQGMLALKVKFKGEWGYSQDFPTRVAATSLPYDFGSMKNHTLACLFKTYDWNTNNGRVNLGTWIESAALAAGR